MRTPLVDDVMTKDVVTVRSFAPFRELTMTMLSRGVGALPVVDSIGHPIGIVSRGDLLRVFLRDDAEIREDVIRDVLIDALDADRHTIDVAVEGGVVTLAGTLDSESGAEYTVRRTRGVPGVVDVVDKLRSRYEEDRPAGPGPLR